MLSSCDNSNEQLETLKGEVLTFNSFFDKVSNMEFNVTSEKVIYIEYNWNKKDNTIEFVSSSEKEPSWGVALDLADKNNFKSSGDKYEVSCTNGGKTTKTKCNGKWSCGKAIGKCLDAGGCATICKLKMEYVPQHKSFYLSDELRE